MRLTPLELLERLARLIPLPRMHRHRYHGVLTPNAKLSAAAVAISRPEVEAPEIDATDPVPMHVLPSDAPRARPANLLNPIYGATEIVIPLIYRPLDVRPLESFSRRFLGAETSRSFARTFADLAEFADGIERLPLRDLRDVLDSEMRRTGPQVRLLGFVLPLEVLSAWGVLLILILQADFLIHIQWFWSRIGSTSRPDVPWVGLYGRPLHNAIFGITVGVLPGLTAAWLAYDGIGLWPLTPFRILSLTGLVLVGVMGVFAVTLHLRGCGRAGPA